MTIDEVKANAEEFLDDTRAFVDAVNRVKAARLAMGDVEERVRNSLCTLHAVVDLHEWGGSGQNVAKAYASAGPWIELAISNCEAEIVKARGRLLELAERVVSGEAAWREFCAAKAKQEVTA